MSKVATSTIALTFALVVAPTMSHAAPLRSGHIQPTTAVAPEFNRPRLYVGTDGGGFTPPAINAYHQDARFPEPLQQITEGLEYGAQQMAMDARGRLYVADPDAGVVEYAPHATSPLRTIVTLNTRRGPDYYDAFGVAIDAAGTIYVVTQNGLFGQGYLLEYHQNATHPFLALPILTGAFNVDIDSTGDVFVLEQPAENVTQIVEIPVGSQSTKPVDLKGVTEPFSITFAPDGDFFVSDGELNTILAFHAGETKPYKAFDSGASPGCMTVDATGRLYVCEPFQVGIFRPGEFKAYKTVRAGLSQGAGPLAVYPPYNP